MMTFFFGLSPSKLGRYDQECRETLFDPALKWVYRRPEEADLLTH